MTTTAVLNNDATWHVETCDVLDGLRRLPDGSVHCVVTSPPYWGLRDYGVDGQIGLERSPRQYIAKMVRVFGEVRRVLRDDGTLWLNIGDSYCSSDKWGGASGGKNNPDAQFPRHRRSFRRDAADVGTFKHVPAAGCKPKDLIGVPWRLAFALQEAGWWLRSEIIWAKRSPMPESVTDRPTKSHEQIFLLTKSSRYFYDSFASAEETTGCTHDRGQKLSPPKEVKNAAAGNGHQGWTEATADQVSQRNMRTVWILSTEPFSEAHFATFPTELVRRCLLAGTSERGCCQLCGAPWKRILKKQRVKTRPGTESKIRMPHGWASGDTSHNVKDWQQERSREEIGNRDPNRHLTQSVTTGWRQSCDCAANEPIHCLVLDPFSGAGTTVMTARRMQLRAIGFELNADYATMSRQRILDDAPLLNARNFQ